MTVLFARSHFSIGESTLSPEQIVEAAVQHGYKAAALVDTMTISGMIDFSNAAKKAGIKPIIGCRVRVVADPLYRKPKKSSGEKEIPNPEHYWDLFIKDESGFAALCALLTKASTEDYFYYVPRVGLKDVLDAVMGGSFVVTPSDAQSVLSASDYRDTLASVQRFCALGKRSEFMLRFVASTAPYFERCNALSMELSAPGPTGLSLDRIPIVPTHVARYLDADSADTRDVYQAVCNNDRMSDPWLRKPHDRKLCCLSVGDFRMRVHGAGEALALNDLEFDQFWDWSQQFIDAIGYTWSKMPISLPKMGDNEFAQLVGLCKKGFNDRILSPVMGYQPPREKLPIYTERLKYELGVLKKMGFEGYFLLVQDVVSWSKSQGIKVGPGRGSVGGSLVAFLIGITDVDPIRFDLLFERFINPERIDLPDADLDFMSTRRQEIVDYLVKKYGQGYVAGISNYGTLASASALRDVGRVFGLEMFQLEATKHIPKLHGKPLPLEEAAEQVATVQAFKGLYPDVWGHATKLEGKMRNLGKHAAGIVVSGVPIVERAAVESRSGEATINWDKRYSEDMGLVKLDILGLSTLDVLDGALDRIHKRTGKRIELLDLPLDDVPTLDAFGRGETAGVFQFEGAGMRKLLRNLAVGGRLTFDDLVAAVALYRPGPMDSGMLDDYVAIRQGMKRPSYPHPSMEAALTATGGVIVYQEQVMQVARDFAGYTFPEADKLRKIMGKKLPTEMVAQKDKWVEGAVKHVGADPEFAARQFANIETFAAYGFNKSHSVEYAVISYWCQWLKTHYGAEFFAAALDMADEDKRLVVATDAAKSGIAVAPPDINVSSARFEVNYDALREQWTILAPFSAVKGISTNGCEELVKQRATVGKYRDMAHVEELCKARLVNSRVRENLVKVGAFASIQPGTLPARHPDRLKDQIELLPGLMLDAVKADRKIEVDKFIKAKILHLVQDYRSCDKCSLAGRVHPMPSLGKTPKFMVISDCPNWSEDQDAKMFSGKASEFLREALKVADLRPADGYFTSLVKSIKEEGGLKPDQITGCSQWLNKEIELLKPPVIIAMGGASIRFLLPNIKGGWEELAGRRVYSKELEATIVCAFNPGMISFDSGKQELLNEIFKSVAELVL